MAVDTANKRRSVGAYVLDTIAPVADGTVHPPDRRAMTDLYCAPVIYDDVTGSGGLVLGGSGPDALVMAEEAAGGLVLGGAATIVNIHDEVGSGGIVLGGEAPRSFVMVEVGAGGIVLGGEAEVEYALGILHFVSGARARSIGTPLVGTGRVIEQAATTVESTANKRRSVGGYVLDVVYPVADGSIGANDRRHVTWLYAGPFITGRLSPGAGRARGTGTPPIGHARRADR